MSNYDDILRRKEKETHFDVFQMAKHWGEMEGMMKNKLPRPGDNTATMKKVIKILLITAATVVIGYFVYKAINKPQKEWNGILKPSNVPSQFFTINTNEDVTLRTSHASVLKIKKGTFATDKPVTIEVKEVFTPQEILQSGLTTLADGKLLRSAGMLYFNATTEGDKIEPSIPIDAFVTTSDKDTAMQIFKGKMQSDSTVNWVEPIPVVDTLSKDLEHHISYGKQLFQSTCASCHNVFKDGTGPALKGIQNRGPWKNPIELRKWINNPASFMATNKYTQDLKTKFGSMMTGFPNLSDIDIVGLLAYINNSSSKDLEPEMEPVVSDSLSLEKNCGEDTSYFSIQNNFDEYDTTSFIDFEAIPADTIGDGIFDYSEYEEVYKQGYDFKITSNGWYNVDAYLKTENDDAKDVSLSVEIVNGETLPYNVYVFVPSERVMQYYTTKNGNTYSFSFDNNGTLPLPVRYRAVIIAFGSKGQKVMYGAAEFVIRKEQQIKVTLRETTEEGLRNLLHTHNIDGVQIDAIEKEMQIIPKPCPGSATDTVTTNR